MNKKRKILVIVLVCIEVIILISQCVFLWFVSMFVFKALTDNAPKTYPDDICMEEVQSTIDKITDDLKKAGLITDDAIVKKYGNCIPIENNSYYSLIKEYKYDAYINYHNSEIHLRCTFKPFFSYRKSLDVYINNLYSGSKVSLNDLSIDFDEFAPLFSVLEKYMGTVTEFNGNHFSFEDFRNSFNEALITDFDKNAFESGYIDKSYMNAYYVPRGDVLIYRYSLRRSDSDLGLTDKEIVKQIVGEKTKMVVYRLTVGVSTMLLTSENDHQELFSL